MKKLKLTFTLLAAVAVISAGSFTAMAAESKTPAGTVAELAGKTEQEVIQSHQAVCDGTKHSGACYYGQGHSQDHNAGCGYGSGDGSGSGHGRHNGSRHH